MLDAVRKLTSCVCVICFYVTVSKLTISENWVKNISPYYSLQYAVHFDLFLS